MPRRPREPKNTALSDATPESVDQEEETGQEDLVDPPPSGLPEEQAAADTHDHPSAPPAKKFARRKPGLKLTDGEENRVFDFVEANPMLFDKNHPSFCKRSEKDALWQSLADDVQVKEYDGSEATGPRLSTWFSNMRTTFGKATRTVSGQAPTTMAPRSKWLKERLRFLESHVYRVPKRGGVDLLSQLREKHPERFAFPAAAPATSGSKHFGERSDSDDRELSQLCGGRETLATPTAPKVECQQEPESATARIMDMIEWRMSVNQQHQDDRCPRMAFGRMIGLGAKELDEEAWDGFQMEVNSLLVKYRRDTRQRRQVHVSQPTTPSTIVTAAAATTSGDFVIASSLERQQQQCQQGSLPRWQHVYQSQQQHKSASAPPES